MEYLFFTLALFFGVGYISIHQMRKKNRFFRSMKMVHFRVLIPKKESDADEKKETVKDFKEYIWVMEQLLSSLKAMYSGRLRNKILGQDYISLEYCAHLDEITFYVVVPETLVILVEKQITSFYPDAVIEPLEEINIFKDRKYYSCTNIFIKKPFYYPIKTYSKLETDPINAITNALSKLKKTESSVIQILLRPVPDSWQEVASKKAWKLSKKTSSFSWNPFSWVSSFLGAFFSSADSNENSSSSSDQQSQLESEIYKTIDEKWKKTGYLTEVRVITTGDSQQGCDSQIKNILGAFQQFHSPDSNTFRSSLYHLREMLIRGYIFRQFSRSFLNQRNRFILNTEEIASLFHFPHAKYNRTPEIKWQNFKIVKAPSNTKTEGLYLGTNSYRWATKEIYIDGEDRFRHFYVIGQTGTGKSSILQVLARQDLMNGNGIAVMDPHGDLANDLLPYIPRHRAEDIVYFNPADTNRPMGLNLLEAKTEDEKETVASDAMNIMIKLFGNEIFGPRLQDYFRNGVLTLMDYSGGGAITDVVRLFTDDAFQKERTMQVKNKVVKAWWDYTFAKMGDREKAEIIPYFSAKFAGFITNTMMRNIIGQVKSSFDVTDIMNNKKILFINLSKGILGDFNSNLLGLILVSKIQMAAMQRQKMEKSERKDFFLYIDEFQNFVTDSIESILSEARKYRLGLVLAHQYIAQLEKSDSLTKSSLNLKDAIFGNVGTIMSYKVGPEDGEMLEKQFEPNFSRTDLVNVDAFKAAIKLSIDGQPSPAFSLNVDKPWISHPDKPFLQPKKSKIAQMYLELSRLKYGREKRFIEKEINFRLWAK